MTFQVVNLISVEEWDGGDRHYHKFYMRSKDIAQKYQQEVDPHCYYHEVSLIICDTIQDVKDWKSGELKRKALAKLTAEEKQILGLKD